MKEQKDNSFTIHHKNVESLNWDLNIFERVISKYNETMSSNKTKAFLMNWETAIYFEVGDSSLWNMVQKQYLAPKIWSTALKQ